MTVRDSNRGVSTIPARRPAVVALEAGPDGDNQGKQQGEGRGQGAALRFHAAADSVLGTHQRIRWRVPVLPEAIRRRLLDLVDVTDARLGAATWQDYLRCCLSQFRFPDLARPSNRGYHKPVTNVEMSRHFFRKGRHEAHSLSCSFLYADCCCRVAVDGWRFCRCPTAARCHGFAGDCSGTRCCCAAVY